jgi:glycolate oxidase
VNRSELIENVYTCASCGYCRFGCPVFEEVGFERFTARGRMLIFKKIIEGKLDYTEDVFQSIYLCSQCANCDEMCPTGIDYLGVIETLKRDLAKSRKLPESLINIRDMVSDKSNPYGENREERGSWLPKEYESKEAENLYFVGCAASYSQNRTPKSVMRILDAISFEYTVLGNLEFCCGEPLYRMGEEGRANELVEKNILEFERFGAKRIFASCPGCFKNLKHKYSGNFQVLHAIQLFSELLKEGKIGFDKEFPKRIIYHDGCDIGRHSGVYDEPREVLSSIPGVELLEFDYSKEEAICCGGPLVSLNPDLSRRIGANRVREAHDLGAEVIVTTCPTCFVTFKDGQREAGVEIEVQEISQLLLKVIKK